MKIEPWWTVAKADLQTNEKVMPGGEQLPTCDIIVYNREGAESRTAGFS